MPQSKGKKRLRLFQIFKSYKYKTQMPYRFRGGTSSDYYIPKAELKPNHEFSVTYDIYKEVIRTFFDVIWERLIEGYRVPLPYNFGFLEIVKRKANKSVDWKATADAYADENLGKSFYEMKKIYHENSHTDGYSCRLRWMRQKKNLVNKYAFNLQLTRTRKHQLRDYINEDPDRIYKFNDI